MGGFVTSIRSLDVPCGSWQVVQPSRVGACSHRNGPRLTSLQDVHISATESPLRSCFTLFAPWGLWHDENSILPSRSGMWHERSILATLSRWHVAQVSISRAVFNW